MRAWSLDAFSEMERYRPRVRAGGRACGRAVGVSLITLLVVALCFCWMLACMMDATLLLGSMRVHWMHLVRGSAEFFRKNLWAQSLNIDEALAEGNTRRTCDCWKPGCQARVFFKKNWCENYKIDDNCADQARRLSFSSREIAWQACNVEHKSE